MLKQTTPFPKTARKSATNQDYTLVDQGADGKIVVEFNMWDESLQEHVATVLRLFPEEALLFANMLKRSADTLDDSAQNGLALAAG